MKAFPLAVGLFILHEVSTILGNGAEFPIHSQPNSYKNMNWADWTANHSNSMRDAEVSYLLLVFNNLILVWENI